MKTQPDKHPLRFDPPIDQPESIDLAKAFYWLHKMKTTPLSIHQESPTQPPIITIPYTLAAWHLRGEHTGHCLCPKTGKRKLRYQAMLHGCRFVWTREINTH